MVIVIFFIGRWLVWRGRPNYYTPETVPDRNPIKIIEERYANGDITKEQFEQMVKDIQGVNGAKDSKG